MALVLDGDLWVPKIWSYALTRHDALASWSPCVAFCTVMVPETRRSDCEEPAGVWLRRRVWPGARRSLWSRSGSGCASVLVDEPGASGCAVDRAEPHRVSRRLRAPVQDTPSLRICAASAAGPLT